MHGKSINLLEPCCSLAVRSFSHWSPVSWRLQGTAMYLMGAASAGRSGVAREISLGDHRNFSTCRPSFRGLGRGKSPAKYLMWRLPFGFGQSASTPRNASVAKSLGPSETDSGKNGLRISYRDSRERPTNTNPSRPAKGCPVSKVADGCLHTDH